MQAAFFTRGKKRNSTSHPNGVIGGALYDIVLKTPTSITTPTLTLRLPPEYTTPAYNYCYIPALGERYYFINEWRSAGVNWECDLSVDVLATYSDNILASTQTVLRSTVNPNLQLTNTAVVAGLPETGTEVIITKFVRDITQGTFIIALANDDTNSFGAASLYAMTYEWCGAFMQKLLGQIDWTGSITDISTDLLQCLFNPMEYVLSCRYYPMGMSFFTGDNPTAYTSIRLGHWLIDGVNNVPLTSDDVVKRDVLTSFTIAGHPGVDTYGQWLNYPPYYAAEVFIPPFGTLAIPPWALGTPINCMLTVDAITGQSILQPYISSPNTTFLEPHTIQLGVDVPIAQLQPDIIGGLVRSQGDNPLLKSTGITDIASSLAPLLNQGLLGLFTSGGVDVQPDRVNGAAGSLCGVYRGAFVTRKYLPVSSDIINKIGYPCFRTDLLQAFRSAVSGTFTPWVQCADPHVVIDNATADETTQIEAFLSEGVYLE